MLIPDITNPLFPPILRGIEDRLADDGYTALIVNTDNDAVRERSHLEAMRARQVDGFISATARLDRELLDEIGAGAVPLVLVNRSLEDGSVPSVTVNDRQGTKLAVDHVAALGHTRIAHVAGPQNLSTGHRRYLGFLEAMRAAGLPAPDTCVHFASFFTEEEGAAGCASLLDTDPGLTAIVAANDLLALGCLDALRARGVRCPERGVDRRLQRHAVHRPPPAPADLRAHPPARDRHRGRRPAARAPRGRGRGGSRDPARAHAHRAGLDGAAPRGVERVSAIDAHAHVIVSELLGDDGEPRGLAPAGALGGRRARSSSSAARAISSAVDEFVELETILAHQRRRGIDHVLLSPWVPLLFGAAPMPEALQRCRLQNAGLARLRALAPDRVSVLGAVPLQDPVAAAAELARLMSTGAFAGVEVTASVGGVYLGDPRFAPFWAAAEASSALVFVHPTTRGFADPVFEEDYLWNLVGNPFETTIAAAHLVMGGTMARHPGLRVLLAHAGGAIVALRGRLRHGHAAVAAAGRDAGHRAR